MSEPVLAAQDDQGCPVCFALPGEACVTPAGTPRNDHAAREKAAKQEARAANSHSQPEQP